MLEIGMLGDFRIVAEGKTVTSVRSARTRALLAYLLLRRHVPQDRQHLAFLFWPDSSEAQARTNLRREIHRLRRCFPEAEPYLALDGSTLWWREEPAIELDVARFERAATEADRATERGEPEPFVEAAERAVRCYRGPLLPALYDDWVNDERDRLQRWCLALLSGLVSHRAATGHLSIAIAHARRRVVLEPLEESGHAVLIRLQAEAGDRAAAIRSFHRCAAVLEREIGTAPGPETVAAYEAVLAERDGSAEGRSRAAVRTVRPRPAARMVGRIEEQAVLTSAWEDRSGARLLCLRGEAGIGKTRLAEWFCTSVERTGGSVARARCFSAYRGAALGPLAVWFSSPTLAKAVAELDEPWRAEVARIVPEPTGNGPVPVLPDPGSGAGLRARLFEACAVALASLDRPTLLYIDDLQWCDATTLEWLAFLFRFAPEAPVKVVATMRVEDLDGQPPVTRALQELSSLGVVTAVDLEPLTLDETAQLAKGSLGWSPGPEMVAALHEATGGFPLFVIETAELWSDHATDDPAHLPVAPRVRAVLRDRLAALSPTARELLDLAAVIGQDFSPDLLIEASDAQERELVDALDELWRRRLVRAAGPGAYDVSHELVRGAVLEELAPARAWLLHRRVAQALELREGGSRDAAARIAGHYERAGQVERAARHHLAAATDATKVLAHDEAIDRFEHALALAERLPGSEARDRLELDIRFALAAPLNAADGYGSLRLQRDLERARVLASQLDERRMLAQCLTGLWAVHFVHGDNRESLRLAEQALRLSRPYRDLLSQVHLALGGVVTSRGDPQTGIDHFRQAVDVGVQDEQRSLVFGFEPGVMALAWGAHALWLAGREEDAVESAGRAVAVADELDNPYSRTVAHAYASITHQMRHDPAQVAVHVSAAGELCRRYGFGYYNEWATILEGWVEGGARGAEAIERGLDHLQAQNAGARRPYYLGLLAETYLREGRREAAADVLGDAIDLARRKDERWWEPELLRLYATLRPGDEVVAGLRAAVALAEWQGSEALARQARLSLTVAR